MIKWTGKTTDKVISYNAQGNTYEEVFENINYKHDLLNRDELEIAMLKNSGYDLNEFDVYDNTIYEYEKFESLNLRPTEEDYYRAIVDHDSQAYYQDFIHSEEGDK